MPTLRQALAAKITELGYTPKDIGAMRHESKGWRVTPGEVARWARVQQMAHTIDIGRES